jgi:hypothetical protein
MACTNNATKENSDAVQKEEIVNSETLVLQNAFPQLFTYLTTKDPHFDKDRFSVATENRLSTVPAIALDEKNMQLYENLLIYNNDSSLAIDLYSYNYIITNKGGHTELVTADPDIEIGLVDFIKGTRKRIYFSGPSTTIWDGAWLKDSIILLAGAEVMNGNKMTPFFLHINLTDSLVQTLQYNDTLQVNMQDYVRSKMGKRL